jgi:ribosome-associated toxin RatA of RatAB toxin-antitoxin module
METEYVSFTEPKVVAVKMTRGPRLLEAFGGTWEFIPLGEGKTRVTFKYAFRIGPRWLSWVLEPLARSWFSWETRRRVVALAEVLKAERA